VSATAAYRAPLCQVHKHSGYSTPRPIYRL